MTADTRPQFDALWDYQDPAASEARFRAALATPTREPAHDVQLKTQIARALGLQRRFAAGHGILDECVAERSADDTIGHIRILLERGRLFNSAGARDDAVVQFEAAWRAAAAAGADFYAVDALHMLGIAAEGAPAQLMWHQRALAAAKTSKDPYAQRWLGSLYNNLGWSLFDAGDFATALETFRQCEAYFAAQGAAQNNRARIARWSIARTLRALGRLDDAIVIQRRLAAGMAEDGTSDGFVQEELGELLLALGRAGESRPHFAAAYRLLADDPHLQTNEPARLARLQQLGGDNAAVDKQQGI